MSLVLVDHPRPDVAVLTMNRPDRLNAMSIELVNELYDALVGAGENNTCRVIVLTGAGRAFSSGLDLKDYGVVPNIDGLQVGQIAQRSMRAYSRLVPLIRHLPQPVIAAVNGPAFGGGMCLTLACELRIASSTAVFNATGIVNGLTSTEMAASYLLPRLIGAAHSNDLLLTGRRIDADEAFRMGLVSRLVADGALLDEAMAMAGRICDFSAYGVAMTKEILWVNLETTSLESAIEIEDRNQLMLGFTENLPEAIRAFDEGRQPVYTDEPRRGMFLP
jgi:enoyl-CoA hydratase